MVHGYSGISVDFNLTVEFLEGPQDSCEEAFPIKLGDSLLGDTGLGLVSGFPTCDGVANDPWSSDVFYRFVAPRAGDFEVTTCTDDVAEPADTKLSVYKGTCRNPVCAGGNDDAGGETCGLRSLVLFSAEEGRFFFPLLFIFYFCLLFLFFLHYRRRGFDHGSRFQTKHRAVPGDSQSCSKYLLPCQRNFSWSLYYGKHSH